VEEFFKFSEEKMETTAPSSHSFAQIIPFRKSFQKSKALVHATNVSRSSEVCHQNFHPLYLCSVFKDLPIKKKLSTVNGIKLCHNCLSTGHHSKSSCSSQKCKKCSRTNHTLLNSYSKVKKNR